MTARPRRARATEEVAFDGACALISDLLAGDFRRGVVAELPGSDLRPALLRLRDSMRSHVWHAGGRRIGLAPWAAEYDRRSRADGFHALHDWDGTADRVNDDIIPVDVLNYLIGQRGGDPADRSVLAILLDYYVVHLLALLTLRVWDEGDADANLDRVDGLLRALQGPKGSGQRFVRDAETLLLIATSHYQLEERGYAALLARTRTLSRRHRVNIAVGHAVSMACHLRFGFEASYGRDTVNMRNDNVADYPWLCFALRTVVEEYARLREDGVAGIARDVLAEALLNGLSPDAKAFVGDHPPSSLGACEQDREAFRDLFLRHREDLVAEFERYRPSERAYSPLSFFFNFAHNVVKGAVVDALLWGDPWRMAFNDLLTAAPAGSADSESRETLATTLMGHARANPHRIRGRLRPVIVYDPGAGRQAFALTLRKIKE